MSDLNCCIVSCDKSLDASYWESQYEAKTTGWDLGKVSPPLQTYIDTVTDKKFSILIPGCGNSYEAEYLLEQGFTNNTVIDIAPTPVALLKQKFKKSPNIKVVLGDFFEHEGNYNLIIEQTFFCALPPAMRQKYVWKMHHLLSDQGILAGLLFNKMFESGPPFGGSRAEYQMLFKGAFDFLNMEVCSNSIAPRANSELFIELKKNSTVAVNLYEFEGITSNCSVVALTKKLTAIDGVLNVSMNTTYAEVLLVSKNEIAIETLQDIISLDEKYEIKKIDS
jgi:hypothetical protein